MTDFVDVVGTWTSACTFALRHCGMLPRPEAARPKLIVFDLDYTLWPFWVDTHVRPPFRLDCDDRTVIDGTGTPVRCYTDVIRILRRMKQWAQPMAVASRTSCEDEARDLIRLFDFEKYFCMKEIYPGQKIQHFERFHKLTGYRYEDMLFFDSELRNIRDIQRLGVTSIHCEEGLTMNAFENGLQLFSMNYDKRQKQNVAQIRREAAARTRLPAPSYRCLNGTESIVSGDDDLF